MIFTTLYYARCTPFLWGRHGIVLYCLLHTKRCHSCCRVLIDCAYLWYVLCRSQCKSFAPPFIFLDRVKGSSIFSFPSPFPYLSFLFPRAVLIIHSRNKNRPWGAIQFSSSHKQLKLYAHILARFLFSTRKEFIQHKKQFQISFSIKKRTNPR